MVNPVVDCRHDGRLPAVGTCIKGAVCEAIDTAHIRVDCQEEVLDWPTSPRFACPVAFFQEVNRVGGQSGDRCFVCLDGLHGIFHYMTPTERLSPVDADNGDRHLQWRPISARGLRFEKFCLAETIR